MRNKDCARMGKMILIYNVGLSLAVALQLLLLSVLLEQATSLKGDDSGDHHAWDKDVTSLELVDGKEFQRIVYPLVQMSANAYRYPDVIAIEGWTLVDAVAPVHGGMHAVLYQDDPVAGKMVLAFRGTDISGTESGRADLCADQVLFIDVSILGPVNCSGFSNETLDYYTQAVKYTRKVLEAYPDTSLLLTGHSLGASLAVLMAASFGASPVLPVIAFSAAGTKGVLKKYSLELTAEYDKMLYIVADKWDEVMRTSWTTQVGTLCLYQTSISDDCVACFSNQGISPNCSDCFYGTHYLQHVIDLVVLGMKPTCAPPAGSTCA